MNIVVCTPCYSQGVDWEHLSCIEEMQKQSGKNELAVSRLHGCALIEQARSAIAEEALNAEPKADVLLWVDDDILFDASDGWSLCEQCVNDYPIIGAACSTRRANGRLCCDFPEDVHAVPFFENGGVYRVNSIGLGLTAIRRDVIEAVGAEMRPVMGVTGKKIRPLFRSQIIEDFWVGEDYSFCRLAAKHGFSSYVDTRPRTWHKGLYGYRVEDVVIHVPKVEHLKIDVQTNLGVIENDEPERKTGS